MQTVTMWRCHRCALTFNKEQIANTHHEIFGHPVQKIATSILN
ncbi:MAG: hypothetical protein OEX98_05790 [Nitrosopumilus sp.]|nr:hypothetical protein [Nitrosopumilus sp.]